VSRKFPLVFVVFAGTFWCAIADAAEPSAASTFGDDALPMLLLIVVVLVGGYAWRRMMRSPTRGLRRALVKARRFNEEHRDMEFPYPVPEMRDEFHVDPSATERPPDGLSETTESHSRRRGHAAEQPPLTDSLAQESLQRLARLRNDPDEKNPLNDYFRLDAFVRRYLMERYHIQTYGLSVSQVLDALPHDLTSGVTDYSGEILHLCELAQLRRFRPSRQELDRLFELTEAMILNDARQHASGRRPNARA